LQHTFCITKYKCISIASENQYIDLENKYSLDVELIPHALTAEGCPKNRNYRILQLSEPSLQLQTCICDEHCSWDMCNLVNPPKDCLFNSSSNWNWDGLKNTWVAQVYLGNEIYSEVNIMFIE